MDRGHTWIILCMRVKSVPDAWKLHKIKPIPKSKNITEIIDYRPISLLSTVSKGLETIIYSKIIESDFI
jgi:hypothetical protein